MNSFSAVGNLTADPVMRSSSGKPRATLTVAVSEGRDANKKTHFIPVTCFDGLAENVVASLHKGDRVFVQGRLDSYKKSVQVNGEDKELTMFSVIAQELSPSLMYAVADVERSEGDSRIGGRNGRQQSATDDDDEPRQPSARSSRVQGRTPRKQVEDIQNEDEVEFTDDEPAPVKLTRSKVAAGRRPRPAVAADPDEDF